MAKEETIVSGMAGRYASALFALAQEAKATDKVAADLKIFGDLVASSEDLQRLVKSPVFSGEAQTKALSAILAKAGVSGVAANFLKLVAQKRRLFAVGDMIDGFNKLNDAAKGVSRAGVADLVQVEGVNDALAQRIYDFFHEGRS